MKYLVNIQTKEILKEAKLIGQAWGDSQVQLEFLELEDAELSDGSYRSLTNEELITFISKKNKELREILVSSIEVVHNNVIYQGDETSQDRMSRAINGLPDNMTTISWKASDNSSQELTRVDLKEILFLAGQEQTRIWFS